MGKEQISQAVTKTGGFYIEHVPGEKPSRFYIENSTTQKNISKKPSRFYIEHVPGEKPSRFYIVPEQVLFTLRAKKKKGEEKQAA